MTLELNIWYDVSGDLILVKFLTEGHRSMVKVTRGKYPCFGWKWKNETE